MKKEIDGTVRIISDNPQYSPETINKETTIIGRVIWKGSKENV